MRPHAVLCHRGEDSGASRRGLKEGEYVFRDLHRFRAGPRLSAGVVQAGSRPARRPGSRWSMNRGAVKRVYHMVLIDSGMCRDVRQGRVVNERMCDWDCRSDRENFMGRGFQPVRTAGLRREGPVPLKAGARRPGWVLGGLAPYTGALRRVRVRGWPGRRGDRDCVCGKGTES